MIIVYRIVVGYVNDTNRLINARTIDVFTLQIVAAVIFSDYLGAVVAVFGRYRGDAVLEPFDPSSHIIVDIFEDGPFNVLDFITAVLAVIVVEICAVPGQISIAVIAVAEPAYRGILIEVVAVVVCYTAVFVDVGAAAQDIERIDHYVK